MPLRNARVSMPSSALVKKLKPALRPGIRAVPEI